MAKRKSKPARPAKRSRTRGPTKRSGRRAGIERVKATERAIREIGEERLRPGAVKVSQSRWVTPTNRGLGSGSVAKTLRKITKVAGDPFFSYTIKARFRGRDGKTKTVPIRDLGVPRLKDVVRLRRRKRTKEDKRKHRKATGRMETTVEALQRVVRDEISREVLDAVRAEWGKYRVGLPMGPGTVASRAKARRQLSRIKKRQQASFKVEFNRIVTRKGGK